MANNINYNRPWDYNTLPGRKKFKLTLTLNLAIKKEKQTSI